MYTLPIVDICAGYMLHFDGCIRDIGKYWEINTFVLCEAAGLVRFDSPHVSNERSRMQILGRTGYRGPGQSVAFQYGPNREYKNEAAAKAASAKWLSAENAKQGYV